MKLQAILFKCLLIKKQNFQQGSINHAMPPQMIIILLFLYVMIVMKQGTEQLVLATEYLRDLPEWMSIMGFLQS